MQKSVDIVIVGSGLSGLAMAAYLKQAGRDDFVVLERADDVGGTWRDNAYPGCACDVPSHLYSFSFAPNPEWSSTFSPQAEIQNYVRKTATQENLLPHVHFNTELLQAKWLGRSKRWRLRTSQGSITTRILVLATGPFSAPVVPDIPGLALFAGTVFHSASWPQAYDLGKKRVAVIGTGPSAAQLIPYVQQQAKKVSVFQRTAPWVIPRFDRSTTRLEHILYRNIPVTQKLVRGIVYWSRELFVLPFTHPSTAPFLKAVCTLHMRRYIRDPQLRSKLTPDYAPGCKRIVVSSEYFAALSKQNVEVIKDNIAKIRHHGVVTSTGLEHKVDTIVLGTGFRVTDPVIAEQITGRGGKTLKTAWSKGMQAHRGTLVAGFPNLFLVPGPNTIPAPTSLILTAETQAAYIVKALQYLDSVQVRALEPKLAAQKMWNSAIQKRMQRTVWISGCKSWYLDAHGRNTTLWPDFTFRFRKQLAKFDPSEYHFS